MVEYIGDCTQMNGYFIDNVMEEQREIFYNSFIKYIPTKHLKDLFPQYIWGRGKQEGLRLKNDFHVQYFSSVCNGVRYYIIRHSAIEYLFRVSEDTDV